MRKALRGDTGASHLELGLVVTALGLLIVVMGATFAGALRHTVAQAACPAPAAAAGRC
jgi:Flp pilus assembly pilin Flp